MRIIVDTDLCAAHGDCVVQAPELFDLGDEDDVVVLLNDQVDDSDSELIAKVKQAASSCPMAAIRLDE